MTQALDSTAAYNIVHAKVYAPVFFEKLRDHGIVVHTQVDRERLLTMADQLRTAHDRDQEKRAAAGSEFLVSAQARLNMAMQQAGYQVSDGEARLVKQSSLERSLDPELAHAILSLNVALPAA